jgi:hypothetical protein
VKVAIRIRAATATKSVRFHRTLHFGTRQEPDFRPLTPPSGYWPRRRFANYIYYPNLSEVAFMRNSRLLGLAAISLFMAGFAALLPDIKRYIKINTI